MRFLIFGLKLLLTLYIYIYTHREREREYHIYIYILNRIFKGTLTSNLTNQSQFTTVLLSLWIQLKQLFVKSIAESLPYNIKHHVSKMWTFTWQGGSRQIFCCIIGSVGSSVFIPWPTGNLRFLICLLWFPNFMKVPWIAGVTFQDLLRLSMHVFIIGTTHTAFSI